MPGLMKAIKDEHVEVRRFAARGIVHFSAAMNQHIQFLLDIAKSKAEDKQVRCYLIDGIGSMGTVVREAAEPVFTETAKDSDPEVSAASRKALHWVVHGLKDD